MLFLKLFIIYNIYLSAISPQLLLVLVLILLKVCNIVLLIILLLVVEDWKLMFGLLAPLCLARMKEEEVLKLLLEKRGSVGERGVGEEGRCNDEKEEKVWEEEVEFGSHVAWREGEKEEEEGLATKKPVNTSGGIGEIGVGEKEEEGRVEILAGWEDRDGEEWGEEEGEEGMTTDSLGDVEGGMRISLGGEGGGERESEGGIAL